MEKPMRKSRRAVLIAGPTASGKSALAIEKARADNGIIVNTDSMQIYDVLNTLSARPQPSDLAQAEHALYGFVSPAERFSTGAWLNAVANLIAETAAAGRALVFVGGTGLYFEALQNGVATVPEIPQQAVRDAETEIAPLDRAGRLALLAKRDPTMAARLNEPDIQRTARALSVLAVTGKSLAEWQDEGQRGLLDDFVLERLVLNPNRDVLRQRIADRFANMLESGAVDEVRALISMTLDGALPAMKAIGVREIMAWQAGEMSREEATERAVIATRQYAKRQRTWFRNRMSDWDWMD